MRASSVEVSDGRRETEREDCEDRWATRTRYGMPARSRAPVPDMTSRLVRVPAPVRFSAHDLAVRCDPATECSGSDQSGEPEAERHEGEHEYVRRFTCGTAAMRPTADSRGE